MVDRPEWTVPTADDVRPVVERPVLERTPVKSEQRVVRRTPVRPPPGGTRQREQRANTRARPDRRGNNPTNTNTKPAGFLGFGGILGIF